MMSFHSIKLIFLCIFLCNCHWPGHNKSSHQEVKVIPLKEYVGPYQKEFIGVLKPVRQVTLRARVEGFLESRLFKEGDFVKKDELLFTIDKKPFEAQLLSAKGSLEQAKANLTFQEIQYKRYQQLVVHQNIAKSQYDQQYAQYLEALGKLDTAKGNYEQALLNLGYCSVIAPMAGQVGKAYVDVGNLVSGANKTELVKLIQLDPLRVEFNPSAADIKTFLEYKKNKPFHVEVTLPKFKNSKWQGVVDFYDNAMNLSTSTILLRTTIINEDLLLRPDLYVNVKVVLDPTHHFILVPYTLVTDIQGIRQILVVDKEQTLRWRILKLGRLYKDDVEIEHGLEKGDRVVVDQNLPLEEGTKVSPLESRS
jgi:RND family efflux transporter MFP subunit